MLKAPGDFPKIQFPATELPEFSTWQAFLQDPLVRALAPVPVLLLVAPVLWAFFRKTWTEIEQETREARRAEDPAAPPDYRPAVCLLLTAIVLTIHEYYGGRSFFEAVLRPVLVGFEERGHTWPRLDRYEELWGYAWWSGARVLGYVVVPVVAWKALFPKDSVLDMGLRVRGFFQHAWVYALALFIVLGAMAVVARQRDFLTYYPFYKGSSRSWSDFLLWEALYFAQFFALEFFFRGWMLAAMRRTLGVAAIFVMAVPYCMIHFGKPYLEAHAAIIAGVVLGSLALRSRSIYAGFLVHITVAFLMDFLALHSRNALPTTWWPS
jgi:membrane protease YdiL (CAAX protease family)